MDELVVQQSRGAVNYREGITAAAKGYWSGVFDYDQFYENMDIVIRRGIPTAYYEGAQICGILPNELSPEERQEIKSVVHNETTFINDFAKYIEQNSRKAGGKWGTVASRVTVWVNRYNDARNAAKVSACADQKLKWAFNALGVTKNPCPTCQFKLNGKVKRASYWKRMGIRPQNSPNDKLECGGWG